MRTCPSGSARSKAARPAAAAALASARGRSARRMKCDNTTSAGGGGRGGGGGADHGGDGGRRGPAVGSPAASTSSATVLPSDGPAREPAGPATFLVDDADSAARSKRAAGTAALDAGGLRRAAMVATSSAMGVA